MGSGGCIFGWLASNCPSCSGKTQKALDQAKMPTSLAPVFFIVQQPIFAHVGVTVLSSVSTCVYAVCWRRICNHKQVARPRHPPDLVQRAWCDNAGKKKAIRNAYNFAHATASASPYADPKWPKLY